MSSSSESPNDSGLEQEDALVFTGGAFDPINLPLLLAETPRPLVNEYRLFNIYEFPVTSPFSQFMEQTFAQFDTVNERVLQLPDVASTQMIPKPTSIITTTSSIPAPALEPTPTSTTSQKSKSNSTSKSKSNPKSNPNSKPETTQETMANTRKQRSCDSCSVRKVKCDYQVPCSRCVTHSLECTNIRAKRKPGPKKLHQKTKDAIRELAAKSTTNTHPVSELSVTVPVISSLSSSLSSSSSSCSSSSSAVSGPFCPSITLEYILPCLNVFQVWYYSIWPVISVADLISRKNEPTVYALSCAISAVMQYQLSFMANQTYIPSHVMSVQFIPEAVKYKKLEPTVESILTSLFLHVASAGESGTATSACFLREAITLAQVMGLDRKETYETCDTAANNHRFKKIYYLLVVTERFLSLEQALPVLLEPSIPLPSLENEEYPLLLYGFRELVKIFAIPGKSIFDRVRSVKNDASSRALICKIQSQLQQINILNDAPDIQKANIVLSKYWMMAWTWNVSETNRLVDENVACLSHEFPIKIARDFCQDSATLPLESFQFNGPGVCFKMLTIAKTLIKSNAITTSSAAQYYLRLIYERLSRLNFDLQPFGKDYETIVEIINSCTNL